MVATDLAAKRGVLFKEAKSLELASRIQAIVFDKTGTLTEGKPRITDVVAQGVTEGELLSLAATAEVRSSHPLACSCRVRPATIAGSSTCSMFSHQTGSWTLGADQG
jgi:P-type E1-E2 ATPase